MIKTQSQGYKTVQVSFESGIHLLKNMIHPPVEGKSIGARFLLLNLMHERQVKSIPSECDTHHSFCPRTLQRFSQRFFQIDRCANSCPYLKLLKNLCICEKKLQCVWTIRIFFCSFSCSVRGPLLKGIGQVGLLGSEPDLLLNT